MATPPVGASAFYDRSERLDLMSWLQQVEAHAQSGSSDDQKILMNLALKLPDYQGAPSEIQEVFEKITKVVSKGIHDKDLSPASHKALMALMQRFSPQVSRAKPVAARVLFASEDE